MANISNFKDKTQIKSQDIQIMGSIKRTEGDGMENVTAEKIEIKQTKSRLGETLIYHPTDLKQLSSIPPVTPNGPIVNLKPKYVTNVKDEKHILNSLKLKEPKFIPYEPYKAAVNPIIPYEKKNKKLQKNNVNVNMTVAQVAAMKLHETKVLCNELKIMDENNCIGNEWLKEKEAYEAEIQKLKEENSQLENQLKFQAQVNGELKNLLVAAVGEDLETKVHLLTEDKLQLARALLNSAQHLSTHQEQTEWLAGQCEVWRSKFLASSLMVEELAKWKAALCQRTTDLQEVIKRLLEDRNLIRDISLKTYKILSILRENFDPVATVTCKRHELLSTNIIDLTQGCFQLAEILKVQLLSGVENINLQREINITGLDMKTLAEKTAEQLLMSPKLLMSGRQDVACSAVMGAAVAIGGQIFLPRSDSNITCCPHCSGEIKQI
ncbi:golgin-45 [Apis mellifera caucasica]|uniref:Golgin-45 n=1 Tax=Apis mellifera TaxID=7460 RepID=A0A7M7RBF7_APIME|nr:golgin-45 [Apis mellifera]KAG6796348.1 golgin-45 [Apis mellifera caucasica]|eukprot:XP_624667.3 golgin-45 [Apis mellifera]